MIWHIFKKDWKLQWRLALGAALTQWLLSAVLWESGPSGQSRALLQLVMLLSWSAFLVRGFLIVETVHHDPLPGVRQDWLVRPIRRSELLAAKCLFTVLVVQGPVFAADLMESLADGFSFGASFDVALSRSLYLLITFSLPVLAISSVTKNLLEVLTSGVFGVAIIVLPNALSTDAAQKLAGTGLEWMVEVCCLLAVSTFAAAILTLQFRRRMTVPSRWLAVTGTVIVLCILFVPWQPSAFALQRRLSPAPGAARTVEIALETNPAPLPTDPWLSTYDLNGRTNLRIPLSVSGLPADSILTGDHYEARLIDARGVTRAQAQSLQSGAYQLRIEKQGKGPVTGLNSRNSAVYQVIPIDTGDYVRLKDQKLRMEIDYSVTLLGLAESYALPAVNGHARLPDFGVCRTHVDEFGDSVELSCLQAGSPPGCYSWFLEDTPTGRRNMESYACGLPDYSPYFAQFYPNALARVGRAGGLGIQFHDPTGRTHYAVDAAEIVQATVVIRNFRPLEHFTRRVTIPERTLSEWLAK